MATGFKSTLFPVSAGTEVAERPAEAGGHKRGPSAWRRWLKWPAILLALVFAIDGAGSLLVRRPNVRKRLDARLQAAFGRPVRVDSYSFSVWDGPTLEADGVRVGEDPRFGYEYFLRADSIAVRLRWLSLLRGRFELESLSLSGPTVNIVNDAAGDWNLAEWLGHPAAPSAAHVGPMRVPFVPRFREIDVDEGRINFKRGDEKLPFAFVDVEGAIYSDGPQRWRLDLEATPWRAAELLQQAGTIHVAGSVGGTSSALRPASLELSWTDASAPDFLRLMTGDDSGIRGSLAIGVNAQTSGDGWTLQGQAELGQVHRWDLTERPDSPSLNIAAHMFLNIPQSTLQITDATIEGPSSNLQGSGEISWAARKPGTNGTKTPVTFEVKSAGIDFADLLAWARAFRQNVPDSLMVKGFAEARGDISGWPARVTDLTVRTYGAEVSGAGLREPLRLGETEVNYDKGLFKLPPTTLTLGGGNAAAVGSFRIELAAPAKRTGAKASTGLQVAGSAADADDVIAAANAFGWNLAHGWQITGPFHCDLHWPAGEWPWTNRPLGTLSVGGTDGEGASLRAPFLNLPVSGLDARMDLKPGSRHVTLTAAQAFGARWTGTLDRSDSAPEWEFAVSADRLASAELDRWLNPRWRESFIDRMLPFLNAGSPAGAVPDDLKGSGRISVAEFSASPFVFRNIEGELAIDGRRVVLGKATAQLFSGRASGEFDARLFATPGYHAHATFSGVDLAAFSGGTEASTGRFEGAASGEADFSMLGTARSDFAESLACKGALDIRNAAWRGINLIDSVQAAALTPGESTFGEASAQFSCLNGVLMLRDVVLANAHTELDASGTIDFTRQLALQLRIAKAATAEAAAASRDAVIVTGTLSTPEFSKVTAVRRTR
ncbi:MAG TPA: AsmA-like C-terminal region-containing protein [Candidatus Aquilonibacter sp.]|nr:AsmA-like C-terminal region-containing protein [Candidatus Aquilonibacter sp.]